ncbi:DUF993 family protein [Leucobacter tenebrionis]|uniref:DUF993 family protein n=1 Tax=Leucobacter tenebrionis TaxID=2873270 RepID=UPI001CA615B4|nr:DUF993 family protein [Leucobacter tenebrionis]QZY50913.1 dihydrodipicolinate synthase family protein [Leucobacter tenebrionis]
MSERTFLSVPAVDGGLRTIELREPADLIVSRMPPTAREVYSAAHVVADPRLAAKGATDCIDWQATMRVRHRLWDLGLGIAESMDTAQRGMGLSSRVAMELGRRTVAEGRDRGGKVVVGIATDTLAADERDLIAIEDAYIAQLEEIEGVGGRTVMMASRQLAAAATSADDYVRVYDRVLSASKNGVVLHWLGSMFDPALRGYWGSEDIAVASQTVRSIIEQNAVRVSGIKISLLDETFEAGFRRSLPEGVRVYTGDDFNYVNLIAGDNEEHSDALLGAFAAVPQFASAAFAALDRGDVAEFRRILEPTQEVSRLVFEAPTQYYKVGVAWLSFLNGWQQSFKMLDGFETGRSVQHLVELLEAGDRIGLFPDPEFTARRAQAYFSGLGFPS